MAFVASCPKTIDTSWHHLKLPLHRWHREARRFGSFWRNEERKKEMEEVIKEEGRKKRRRRKRFRRRQRGGRVESEEDEGSTRGSGRESEGEGRREVEDRVEKEKGNGMWRKREQSGKRGNIRRKMTSRQRRRTEEEDRYSSFWVKESTVTSLWKRIVMNTHPFLKGG